MEYLFFLKEKGMADMPFSQLAGIKERIEKAKRVAIFAHKNPDGDALGSVTALGLALDELGVNNDLYCVDKPGETFDFLPRVRDFEQEIRGEDYDLIIIPDAADMKLVVFAEGEGRKFFEEREIIKIDHHPNGHFLPERHWVDASYASVTEMLVDFFKFAGWGVTPEIATCLLTGLYTDTGSFQHSNTSTSVLRKSAFLLRKGANFRVIAKRVFQSTKYSTLRLWGRVMSRIEKNEEGVVFSAVTKKDYEECGATREELAGVVDYLNAVKGSKYSVLLTEENGHVKGSLRTKGEEVNVAEIAKKFGGGGHVKAAGFAVPGRLKAEMHWRVIPQEENQVE